VEHPVPDLVQPVDASAPAAFEERLQLRRWWTEDESRHI
jgi:hypothetical protein